MSTPGCGCSRTKTFCASEGPLFATVTRKAMAPVCTALGVLVVFETDRSETSTTVTFVDELLFDVFGSGVVDVTVCDRAMVSPAVDGGMTTLSPTIHCWPAGSTARVQVWVSPETVQVPPWLEVKVGEPPGGMGAVKVRFSARVGPLLVTVTVSEAVSPARTVVTTLLCVSTRSALSRIVK